MNRILITRTDRIGDVLLSTPVFRALRDAYPESHIAVLVRPYAKDIVEGNPYIDEVIIYDKYGKHKTIIKSLVFTVGLARKKFDTAIILHPTTRMHIITMLAGIRTRIGYNRKCGFLLTKKIPHTKQFGRKHELDYNLDVLRAIGIRPEQRLMYFPVRKASEEKIAALLKKEGVRDSDMLVAIHPAASCPSKRWAPQSFARVADELVRKFGVKIVVVSGADARPFVKDMTSRMRNDVIDFSGKTKVGELGSLLKRASLLISNDSGPVHVAAALGVSVIAIFGRKDSGLSPTRWKPLGKDDIIFHKNVGCQICLAHNCRNEFKCLKAVTVEEVLKASRKLLNFELNVGRIK